jgi:hypothetical protein
MLKSGVRCWNIRGVWKPKAIGCLPANTRIRFDADLLINGINAWRVHYSMYVSIGSHPDVCSPHRRCCGQFNLAHQHVNVRCLLIFHCKKQLAAFQFRVCRAALCAPSNRLPMACVASFDDVCAGTHSRSYYLSVVHGCGVGSCFARYTCRARGSEVGAPAVAVSSRGRCARGCGALRGTSNTWHLPTLALSIVSGSPSSSRCGLIL